jgi:hypothetical protein
MKKYVLILMLASIGIYGFSQEKSNDQKDILAAKKRADKYIKDEGLVNLKKIYGKVFSIDEKEINIQFEKLVSMGNMQVYSLKTSVSLCYFPEKISAGDVVEIYGGPKKVMKSPYDDWFTVYIRFYKKKP